MGWNPREIGLSSSHRDSTVYAVSARVCSSQESRCPVPNDRSETLYMNHVIYLNGFVRLLLCDPVTFFIEVKAAQKKEKNSRRSEPPYFFFFFFCAAFTSYYEESGRDHTMTAKKIRLITVFIRISAQPRVSAHLASKHPSERQNKLISAHPTPLPPTKTPLRDNKRPYWRRSFLQSILQKPCFVTSLLFVFTVYYNRSSKMNYFIYFTSVYCFVAKYTYCTCWEWWKFNKRPASNMHAPTSNKRPPSRSKNLISTQGG